MFWHLPVGQKWKNERRGENKIPFLKAQKKQTAPGKPKKQKRINVDKSESLNMKDFKGKTAENVGFWKKKGTHKRRERGDSSTDYQARVNTNSGSLILKNWWPLMSVSHLGRISDQSCSPAENTKTPRLHLIRTDSSYLEAQSTAPISIVTSVIPGPCYH